MTLGEMIFRFEKKDSNERNFLKLSRDQLWTLIRVLNLKGYIF